jgi:hypothetical protein
MVRGIFTRTLEIGAEARWHTTQAVMFSLSKEYSGTNESKAP